MTRFLTAALFLSSLAATQAPAASLTLQSLESVVPTLAISAVVPGPTSMPNRSYVLHLNGAIGIWDTSGDLPQDLGKRLLNGNVRPKGLKQAYGMAFAPDFETSHQVYMSFSDAKGRNRVVRYEVETTPLGELHILHETMENIIRIPSATGKTTQSHFGGAIAFGPDGYLYLTTGDSNSDFEGLSVAQDTSSLLGKVLRLDVTRDDYPKAAHRNYGIPEDNPDFGADAAPELWAIGLRNPYQASFDALTGRLFLPDVGEITREELNIGAAGANYGWSAKEGTVDQVGTLSPEGTLTDPIYDYTRGPDTYQGYSVIGGEVYRGDLAALSGQYVFGDFVAGADGPRIWSFNATADSLTEGDITAWDIHSDKPLGNIISFGLDDKGRLYVADFDGGLFLVTDAQTTPTTLAALSVLAAPSPVPTPLSGMALTLGLAALAALRRRP